MYANKLHWDLTKTKLFKGLTAAECAELCRTVSPTLKEYERNSVIARQGDYVTRIGLVKSGKLISVKYHFDGESQVLRVFHTGDVFGLEAASSRLMTSPVALLAAETCMLVLFPYKEMHSYTIHEPIGVCALITPWNFPFLIGTWKLAPALAAGNSIIFKPSSNTPLSSAIMFEIFDEIGLPKGTVNLVMGSGGTVGQTLAESHDVDMLSFTGSTSVGQGIAHAAAHNLKKVGLELGGKSPNVIFADADLEGAVEWAMIGVFFNQGEVCSAGSRIIIEESIKDRFVKRLAEKAAAIRIGNPLHNPDMGPLVSKEHMETVLAYIEIGKKEGAKCVVGGGRHLEEECANGYYVKPTIFDDCTPNMRIVREEIFGPVVTIQTFKTEEEAIAMANDTPFGLAGAVFTTDGARALRVIKEIRAGITWINCYNPTFNEAPWGGYKMSGLGRELGVNGLEEYQEIKQVNINLAPGPVGWYCNPVD